ncbi:TetR/AcrR family transcriptional regulator [Allonocardiopsis opalescens]|uniref:TetR family transcriptional regulator n=1 Tax=Allonocardiopsis opalescens TaxID=1144618 RepID=A0A2T0PXV2_9ACTN|nr:TetR/AcrR family transcriptional regulator [Allonocardiopsis opalescens]PRX96353.1 TetR family transcriptional regulator [Allonocardiopsis opalescens]
MARPRTFDEERAVDAAMRTFWRSGYEATSTQDLCEATGLGRSSVYNAFSSKRELFGTALHRYMELRTARTVDLLAGEAPIREKLRTLLWWIVDGDAEEPTGCLVVNSTVELAPRDPEVADALRRDRERRFEALRSALDAARRAGEIAPDREPAALAHFFIAAISGMNVAACGGADRQTLAAIAETALRSL